MNRAHVSRTVTKNRLRDASYDGDMKFVPPYQSGQVTVPARGQATVNFSF